MRRQRAVEMLGAVSVIATDKTGTLTENRMRATKFWPATHTTRLLTVGAVCNDVAVDGLAGSGDPLDRALVEAAQAHGVDVDALRTAHSLVDEYSFDSARQRMSVTVRRGRRLWVTVKGAPESVLEVCTTVLIGDSAKQLTSKRRAAILSTLTGTGGLRVVALAEKESNAAQPQPRRGRGEVDFSGSGGDAGPAPSGCTRGNRVLSRGWHPHRDRVRRSPGDGQRHRRRARLSNQRWCPYRSGPGDARRHRISRDRRSALGVRADHARAEVEDRARPDREGHHVAATGDGINDAPALAPRR